MRIAIQRKQPMTLTAAVQEGFLEWELQDNPPQIKRSNNQMENFSSKSKAGKQKRGPGKTIQHSNSDRNNTITAASSQKLPCSHWKRGFHSKDDCWIKHPEKKPHGLPRKQNLHNKVYALLETLGLGDEDSGATMDGVSPKFCSANGLMKNVVNHQESMEITLAGKQTMTVPTLTVSLTVYMDHFPPYTNDCLVIDVPEDQDVLLGMPWLKAMNPDIDWVNERVRFRENQKGKILDNAAGNNKERKQKKKVMTPHIPKRPVRRSTSPRKKTSANEYFTKVYYSTVSGTTKYITSKQFRRMLESPKNIEYIFVIRPRTEKKLPPGLPPREHGEHIMGVNTNEAIFRRQWRQSPVQEKVIMDWVRELRSAGLIRHSTSPHGAPTLLRKTSRLENRSRLSGDELTYN
ncbi:Hypothetical protein PHPALM_18260 [Phytophthora palmivora]|uniref:Pol protein n=1 Tax=Phytophthora palmivora TaxID=4796 RepID=A0A2P4XK75_9STRA|nr:Hypothetical protein PHPALM_18260 [Phytophthora palmivora]